MIDINVGLIPNDGTGDKLRSAMIIINDNFGELLGLIEDNVSQLQFDNTINIINNEINNILNIYPSKNQGKNHPLPRLKISDLHFYGK